MRLITHFLLTYLWLFVSEADSLVISLEDALRSRRFCEKVFLNSTKFYESHYEPLIDQLFENGCRFPVRQNELEADFKEALPGIREMVKKELFDWENFKLHKLEIPREYPEYKGYQLITDISPFCTRDGQLYLQVCYSKNPTRTFGIPVRRDYKNGTIQEIDIPADIFDNGNCTVQDEYARCYSKRIQITLRQRTRLHSSFSPISTSDFWSSNPENFAILLLIPVLLLIVIVSIFKISTREKEEKNPAKGQEIPSIIIPFIDDDSVTIDI